MHSWLHRARTCRAATASLRRRRRAAAAPPLLRCATIAPPSPRVFAIAASVAATATATAAAAATVTTARASSKVELTQEQVDNIVRCLVYDRIIDEVRSAPSRHEP
jgi:hypothetical protein